MAQLAYEPGSDADRQPGASAHDRMAAVAPHGEIGTDLDLAVGAIGANAGHPALLLEQLDCFRRHAQMERRIISALLGEKIQKMPLRHQRKVFGPGRHITKIRKRVFSGAETFNDNVFPLVGQCEEFVEEAEGP